MMWFGFGVVVCGFVGFGLGCCGFWVLTTGMTVGWLLSGFGFAGTWCFDFSEGLV